LRQIIEEHGLAVGELSADKLNEKVGYIIGRDGFEPASEPYAGAAPDLEFILMDNLSEASLDRFLAACKEAGVSVGAKGITTDTNVTWTLHQLIGDISDEHELMTTMDDLSKLAKGARAIRAEDYDTSSDKWAALQDAIAGAERALSLDEETAGGEDKLLDAYREALGALRTAMAAADGARKQALGAVLISCEKQADGTYTLTGSIEGMAEEEADAAAFAWSDGVVGRIRAGVTVEQLPNLKLSVTSSNRIGSGDAQLQKPSAPTNVSVSVSDAGVASVSWNASEVGVNQLPVTGYIVHLYEKQADGARGSLVASKRLDAQTREVLVLSAQSVQDEPVLAAAAPLSIDFEGVDPRGRYMADVTAQSDLGSSAVAESAPASDAPTNERPSSAGNGEAPGTDASSPSNVGAGGASQGTAAEEGNATQGEMEPKPAPAHATGDAGNPGSPASTPLAGDSLGCIAGGLAIAAACCAALIALMRRRMRE